MLLRKLRFWVLSFVIDFLFDKLGHDNVLRVQTSILKSFVLLNFLLPRFHREGQTTSCKKEKSMNVLPPCYDAFVVRTFCTFVLISIYRIIAVDLLSEILRMFS